MNLLYRSVLMLHIFLSFSFTRSGENIEIDGPNKINKISLEENEEKSNELLKNIDKLVDGSVLDNQEMLVNLGLILKKMAARNDFRLKTVALDQAASNLFWVASSTLLAGGAIPLFGVTTITSYLDPDRAPGGKHYYFWGPATIAAIACFVKLFGLSLSAKARVADSVKKYNEAMEVYNNSVRKINSEWDKKFSILLGCR